MKSFITGANGFLGTALCAELRVQGHEVTAPRSAECDLTRDGSLEKFSAIQYERIYHLAAWTQAGDFCIYHPGEQWVINQQINTNVLSWWQKDQPAAKLIFMGTSCAYAPGNALTETNYMDGEPIDSLYTYAMTKRMLYQGARALQKQFGLEWLCFVPSTLYGPGYHTDGRQMHFIFDLVRKIIRAKEYNETVVLWGNGYQKREIIHVKDFISTMLKADPLVKNDIYNIGAGMEYSIREFAAIICDIVGYDPARIEFDTSRYVGAESKCLSVEKISRLLPGYREHLTSLQDGIGQTIQWFYEMKAY